MSNVMYQKLLFCLSDSIIYTYVLVGCCWRFIISES